MGAFSQEMKQLVIDLTRELGNPCTLTKVTKGVYDPLTGETPPSATQTITTFSAPAQDMTQAFGSDGENTNLDGFDSEAVMIPFFPGIDKGWLYDGQNITSLAPLKTQGEIVAYNISVGVKE
jgi:hypothetical protein